ncbi:hypothetical protein KP509_29G036300 [Ceratopteris richardii]|uniref:Reverse transcriptase domain-containing protein n=1 Tax=Ceratopteris richardii TaxID=49495 RepID=A0A8T2R7R6_CERRI|nr:hypothetical protein KP509_29G036300 [Ceratopteris richardii]
MFYLLEAKMNSQCIHGISFYGIQQIGVGFADDTFIFARADKENVQRALRINKKKSAIVNISASHFQSLEWEGPKIEKATIFRHLGYPLGVNVPAKDKIEWVLCKIKWSALQWPLHARIRIVQAFLQPYIMYYLVLLDWKKSHLRIFDSLLKNFLWNKKHNRALVLSAWEYIYQPKYAGGLGILHLHSHLMARREAFIMRITSSHKPLWAHIFWECIENAEVNFKRIWKLELWNKFFSHAPLKLLLRRLIFCFDILNLRFPP